MQVFLRCSAPLPQEKIRCRPRGLPIPLTLQPLHSSKEKLRRGEGKVADYTPNLGYIGSHQEEVRLIPKKMPIHWQQRREIALLHCAPHHLYYKLYKVLEHHLLLQDRRMHRALDAGQAIVKGVEHRRLAACLKASQILPFLRNHWPPQPEYKYMDKAHL